MSQIDEVAASRDEEARSAHMIGIYAENEALANTLLIHLRGIGLPTSEVQLILDQVSDLCREAFDSGMIRAGDEF